MGELFRRTVEREAILMSQGYTIVSIWECEYDRQMKIDRDFRVSCSQYTPRARLNPRDSLYGGRTNALRLEYHCRPGERILYKDVVSEYPYVNKNCVYPVGDYKVILDHFEHISKYFGVAFVKVLPPRNLYIPILPYRTTKLTFPLCRTCAELEQTTECLHDVDDRCLIGTWVTVELMEALKHNYEILEIFEVYHYPLSKPKLFQPYVDEFLAHKVHASGLPAGVETPEQIDQFVSDFFAKEGVRLDPTLFCKNPGLRCLAKYCLNSFCK